MMAHRMDSAELKLELEAMKARLAEAEEALDAIRSGAVDGLVINGVEGQRVFTLQGAEEPYRLLIEQISEGALMLSTEGVVLYANETFARLLQAPLGKVIGSTFESFVVDEDRRVLKHLLADAQLGLGRGRIRVCCNGGPVVPLRLGLNKLQVDSETLISVVATDLTEIIKQEDELRDWSSDLEQRVAQRTADLAASRLAALNIMEDAVAARESFQQAEVELERLGAAVAQTADSIVITDIQGNIEYVNPAFERVTGYTKKEALGNNPRMLKSNKNDREKYVELWETITRGEVWAGQLTNRKKDGTEFSERVTISAVRDATGKIVNYIAVKQDVTAHEQLEEQLRQSQKLKAIGQLAGGVAHDFNNLLTVIGGYSDLLLRRLPEDSPFRMSTAEIKKAADRAAGLTRQLLAFSRKQILQPKLLDLNTVVRDLDKMLRRLIGEDIDLLTITEPQLDQVKADPGQIEQVVMNIIVNARDAMPLGGKITVRTANVKLTDRFNQQHAPMLPGHYVMLVITDTGCGMDAETMGRIFEPFFTTKPLGKGTGLGLATVYGIVNQSGGQLWVESTVGEGTSFKIYLPRAEVDPVVEDSQADALPVAGSETILLVEDEEQVRKLTAELLQSLGYQVLEAHNGQNALQVAAEFAGDIELTLTDVVMPVLSGRDYVDQLAATRPRTKVIFMSGYTDDAIVRHGLLDERIAFIQKPFAADALARKIRQTLDGPPPKRGRNSGPLTI